MAVRLGTLLHLPQEYLQNTSDRRKSVKVSSMFEIDVDDHTHRVEIDVEQKNNPPDVVAPCFW